MKIVSVAAECDPWCRTGGLGDVVAALPSAMMQLADVDDHLTLLPLYNQAQDVLARRNRTLTSTGVTTNIIIDGQSHAGEWMELVGPEAWRTCFLDCPSLFTGPALYDMGPNHPLSLGHRFGAFVQAVANSLDELAGTQPDAIHLHDWHVAPLAQILQGHPARVVLTVHNLAYQGWFPRHETCGVADPGDEHISFLRMGIEAADTITTVSPQYAQEIQTEPFGCGLHELLTERGVSGVVNGVDPVAWDPAQDTALNTTYSANNPGGKAECRHALLESVGWPHTTPELVCGIVTRLAEQKGLDWLLETVPKLSDLGARIVLLGTGDPELEEAVHAAIEQYPDALAGWVRFDTDLSHQIIAGVDALLVPSRFEPCGLTQLYAMRYGTVPIVNPVGGLADTVAPYPESELATGFHMTTADTDGLSAAIASAADVSRNAPDTWRALQANGFAFNSSWTVSAEAYYAIFRA